MKLYSALYQEFHPLDIFYPKAKKAVALTPEDLDEPGILILHGGSDIDAKLYNKGRSSKAGMYSFRRDQLEWDLLKAAKDKNIFVFGICRGAQMLCAAAGGYLLQHVDNHAGMAHKVFLPDGGMFMVNSYHHQMQAPWDVKHEMLATSEKLTTVRYDVDDKVEIPDEPEAVFYPDIHGMGVQWHPEWLSEHTEANKWLQSTLKRWW